MSTVATTTTGNVRAAFRRFSLQKAFYLGVALLFLGVASIARAQYTESAIGAVAIIFAAILPSGIWIRRRAHGLPIFPIFAFTHIWTFALPLIQEHRVVMQFPANAQLVAGLSVAAYLLLATIVWNGITRSPSRRRSQSILLKEESVDFLFLAALAADIVFEASNLGGWYPLSPGVYSILRALIIAVNALSCFILSYRLGAQRLGPATALAFKVIITALVTVYMPALLMINAMTLIGISVFGYTLGAHRVPWRVVVSSLALFSFLHAGKAEMRSRYWSENEDPRIQPLSYPGFLVGWVKASGEKVFRPDDPDEEQGGSLIERASLMHVLLYVETMTPDDVPYLFGETYGIIPELLVPRVINADKGASHEGTYLLNIHYGFQTREQTAGTTLAFGMVNEAYANFGFAGLGGLGIALGAFYGLVERAARGAPVLSLRFLFAILVTNYAIQSEYTAGVYVAGMFQSTIALGILAMVLMRSRPIDGAEPLANA